MSESLKESCGLINSNEIPRCWITVGVEVRDGRSSCNPNVTCFPLALDLDSVGGCGKLKLDNERVEVLDVWIEAGGARGFPLYAGNFKGNGRFLVLSSLSG